MSRQRLAPGEELGVDWDRLADGQVWRLKRNRDFGDVDPNLVRKAARNAALRMGKGIQTLRDRTSPDKYMWVQFADHEIRLGDPCPCGSRKLYRLHTYFARCAECHAQLLLSRASVDDADPAGAAASEEASEAVALLQELEDVHLAWAGGSGDRPAYRGYGRRDGALVFLAVLLRHSAADAPADAAKLLEQVAEVQVVPVDVVADLFDPAALGGQGDRDWDFVL